MSKYYLYRHCFTNHEGAEIPFYIGVGAKQNSFSTYKTEYRRAFTFNGRNEYWNNIYTSNTKNIKVEILYECDNRKEILNKEKEFVSLYGRYNKNLGPLTNLDDGGLGRVGFKHSEKTRKIISLKNIGNKNLLGKKANLGKKFSIEWRAKQSYSKMGKPMPESAKQKLRGRKMPDHIKAKFKLLNANRKLTDEHIEILRQKNIGNKYCLGKKHSEDQNKKMSAWMKENAPNRGKKFTKEHREKISYGRKGITPKRSDKFMYDLKNRMTGNTYTLGYKHTEETKRKISEAGKRPCSDETKRKIGLANKGKKNYWKGRKKSLETRKKMSLAMKGKKKSPEYIAKMSQALKGRIPWNKGLKSHSA